MLCHLKSIAIDVLDWKLTIQRGISVHAINCIQEDRAFAYDVMVVCDRAYESSLVMTWLLLIAELYYAYQNTLYLSIKPKFADIVKILSRLVLLVTKIAQQKCNLKPELNSRCKVSSNLMWTACPHIRKDSSRKKVFLQQGPDRFVRENNLLSSLIPKRVEHKIGFFGANPFTTITIDRSMFWKFSDAKKLASW